MVYNHQILKHEERKKKCRKKERLIDFRRFTFPEVNMMTLFQNDIQLMHLWDFSARPKV